MPRISAVRRASWMSCPAQHAPARRGRQDRVRHLEAVLTVQMREPRHVGQRRVFLRVQFGQMRHVAGPQEVARDQRRSGIGVGSVARPRRRQRGAERMVVGKPAPVQRPDDARARLAGARRLGRGQVVKAAPGVGFGVGEGLVLARQPRQRHRQQRMLVDVGRVSGVKTVLVGQHPRPIARADAVRKRGERTRRRQGGRGGGAAAQRWPGGGGGPRMRCDADRGGVAGTADERPRGGGGAAVFRRDLRRPGGTER